jgi:hypothetical protein
MDMDVDVDGVVQSCVTADWGWERNGRRIELEAESRRSEYS